MSARQPRPYDSIARKWLALAERRRAFLIALRDSGRWQDYHYSDVAEVDAQLREIDLACERFAAVAGAAAAADAAPEAAADATLEAAAA
jgi:hypothetical protein